MLTTAIPDSGLQLYHSLYAGWCSNSWASW